MMCQREDALNSTEDREEDCSRSLTVTMTNLQFLIYENLTGATSFSRNKPYVFLFFFFFNII